MLRLFNAGVANSARGVSGAPGYGVPEPRPLQEHRAGVSFDSVQWECSVLQTSCVHLVTSSQRLCRHNLVGLFVSFSKVKNASSPHSIRSPIKRTSHTQTHTGRWILEHTLSSVCKYLLQSIGSWHSKHFTEATLKNLACFRTMRNDCFSFAKVLVQHYRF